ncbi:MAG TPA: hypothetical protein VF302_01370, partial [Candidatus Limnocylindrales bacterium]
MRGGDRGLDSRQTASILVEKIAALLGISEGAAVALQLLPRGDAGPEGRHSRWGDTSSRRSAMRNAECTIYITTKRGWTQRYRRDKNGWTQTGPNGVVRPMTAEQLLSHILPPLAAGNPDRL